MAKTPLLTPNVVRPDTGPFGVSGTKGLNPFGRGNRMRRVTSVFAEGGSTDSKTNHRLDIGKIDPEVLSRLAALPPRDDFPWQMTRDYDFPEQAEGTLVSPQNYRAPAGELRFAQGGSPFTRTRARRTFRKGGKVPHFDFGGLFSSQPSSGSSYAQNSNFSTGVTNNNIASQPYLNLENQVLGNAAGLQGATASQYVAPFNGFQNAAFQGILQNQGNYQPYYNAAGAGFSGAQGTAANIAPSASPYVTQAGQMQTGTQAANPYFGAASQSSAALAPSYESPFITSAVDALGAASNKAFTALGGPLSQINDTFTGGAAAQFGREGHGNAVGNAVYNQQQALDQAQSSLLNTGFQNAETAAGADLTRLAGIGTNAGSLANSGIQTEAGLGTTQAGIGTAATNAQVSAGQAQQGLGTATQNAGYTDLNALLSAGNQQQQQQQQVMSFPLQLQQYMQSLGQGWQLPTSSNFTNSGNSSNVGGNQTTQGSGSPAGQILGGAATLAGAVAPLFGSSSANDPSSSANLDKAYGMNGQRGGQYPFGEIKHFNAGGYNPTVTGVRKRNAMRRPPPQPGMPGPPGPMGAMGGMQPTGMPGMPPAAPPMPQAPQAPPPPGPMGPNMPMRGGPPMPMQRRAHGGRIHGYADGGGTNDAFIADRDIFGGGAGSGTIGPSKADFKIVPGQAPAAPQAPQTAQSSGGGGGIFGQILGAVGPLVKAGMAIAPFLARGGKFDYGETEGRRMNPFQVAYGSQYFAGGGAVSDYERRFPEARGPQRSGPVSDYERRIMDHILRDQNDYLSPPGPFNAGAQTAYARGGYAPHGQGNYGVGTIPHMPRSGVPGDPYFASRAGGGMLDDADLRGGASPFLDSSTGLAGRMADIVQPPGPTSYASPEEQARIDADADYERSKGWLRRGMDYVGDSVSQPLTTASIAAHKGHYGDALEAALPLLFGAMDFFGAHSGHPAAPRRP